MSFFGKLRELGEIFSESGKELHDILRDTKDEFKELASDGFKEMVIKKNGNYKTSFEKNDLATDRIDEAEENINKRLKSFDKKAKKTSKELESYTSLKLSIQQSEISDWLSVVQQYHVDLKKLTMENYHSFEKIHLLSLSEINELQKQGNQYKKRTMASLGEKPSAPVREEEFPFPALGGISAITLPINITRLGQQKKRVQQANVYLEEAEDYSRKVDLAIEKIKIKEMELTEIDRKMKEGKKLLTSYQKMLVDLNVDLRNAEKNSPDFQTKMKISYLLVSAIYHISMIQLVTKAGKVSIKAKQLHQALSAYENQFMQLVNS